MRSKWTCQILSQFNILVPHSCWHGPGETEGMEKQRTPGTCTQVHFQERKEWSWAKNALYILLRSFFTFFWTEWVRGGQRPEITLMEAFSHRRKHLKWHGRDFNGISCNFSAIPCSARNDNTCPPCPDSSGQEMLVKKIGIKLGFQTWVGCK